MGNWLAERRISLSRIPQGSFRLGTVVRRPHTLTGFDIDLVFLMFIAKEATTQARLKQDVGDLLQAT